jgi:hypothetical protein
MLAGLRSVFAIITGPNECRRAQSSAWARAPHVGDDYRC